MHPNISHGIGESLHAKKRCNPLRGEAVSRLELPVTLVELVLVKGTRSGASTASAALSARGQASAALSARGQGRLNTVVISIS